MSHVHPLPEAAVMAACLAIVLFAAATLGQRRGTWPAMLWAALGLGWFLAVWQLARVGAFEGTRDSGLVVEVAAMAVTLALAWAMLGTPRRTVPEAADLVALQTSRVAAAVILLALAREALPPWLALPIGLGDSLAAVAALVIARRLGARTPGAVSAARAWNLAGAVLAGFTIVAPMASARSTGYFFSLYPLVLFPTFLAPVWLVLHLAIHRGLAGARTDLPRG